MSSQPFIKWVVQFLWLTILSAATAFGQTTDAVLSGTVTDVSGAVVAGAQVVVQNVRTGVVQQTKTNDAGVYMFPSIQPGVYRLSAEHDGFSKFVYDDVSLEVGARVSLNLELQVGDIRMSVEVKASSEPLLGMRTSSVGGVVSGQKLLDLPLINHDARELVNTYAGVVNPNNHFSGARVGSVHSTLDGFTQLDNSVNLGLNVMMLPTVDRVEEFRVVTSPADAELGRGSGQVQFITRSGTNEFHGSLFEFHRNTVLNANSWFNNFRGRDSKTGEEISPRNTLLQNQFGGRLGGPLIKKRTFFLFWFESSRIRMRNSQTSTTYTETARQGIFRFFPGAPNASASTAVPTVDLAGNPVRPPQATGNLQAVSLFGRDPNRLVADRSGMIRRMLDLMPLPNDFRSGDGLNTAGYTWRRPSGSDVEYFTIRLDHVLNVRHRVTFSQSRDDYFSKNSGPAAPSLFPQGPGGESATTNYLTAFTLTSAFRSNFLNELRAGAFRIGIRVFAPWEVAGEGVLPRSGDQPYGLVFASITSPILVSTANLNMLPDPYRSTTPIYQYGDNLTWWKGRHAFKAGAEIKFSSSNNVDTTSVMARATLGPGGIPPQNVGNIAGIGQNQATAQNLLNELSGSLANVQQAFNSPGGSNPVYLPGESNQRTWRQREISWFFKDDFKLSPNLTLNLGVRYEWYGVPFEAHGKDVALAGGTGGLFGISGTSFADLFEPGRLNGSLTRSQLVGPNSVNPGARLYDNDNNNFAPAVGLSWSLPWFGKDQTVLRSGYGISYERSPLGLVGAVSGEEPGLREVSTFQSSSYLDLSNIRLPLTPLGRPLALVPVTDRTQIVRAFDDHLRTPYIQNWNFSIQRQLFRDTLLDVRYVGSKGTKLIRSVEVNEANIFENGILDAFRITQTGGNSPLLDRIFNGVNVAGLGVVDGVRITGSQAARTLSTTQGFLAGNNVGSLAGYLNNSVQFTMLRRAGLDENFVVANPQFRSARLTGNFANSTYHSLQVEMLRRFSSGWTLQGNYTWSRTLGEEEGDGFEFFDSYRDLRHRYLDKRLLSFHRTHALKGNGTLELPFGPGKKWAGASRGAMARLLERWQIGGILSIQSGTPITLFSGVASLNADGNDNTPVAVEAFSKGTGSVRRVADGIVYFDGLRQVADPSIAKMSLDLQSPSTLRAIADSSGRILLVNPTPGVLGSLASRFLEGPGSFTLNLNLIKRIRVRESKTLELRADVANATNSPIFGAPNTQINSTLFGRINGATGNRIIVVGMRFNF